MLDLVVGRNFQEFVTEAIRDPEIRRDRAVLLSIQNGSWIQDQVDSQVVFTDEEGRYVRNPEAY